jgi:hypothetical protein
MSEGQGWGGGAGARGGRGRGWRHRFWATGQAGWMGQPDVGPAPDRAQQALADQVAALSAQLDTLRARLAAMSEGGQTK